MIEWVLIGLMVCFSGLARGASEPPMRDVGHSFDGAPRVLIVASPGVERTELLFWEQELEASGMDVWLMSFESDIDQEVELLAQIKSVDAHWKAQSYDILAHGYAGRLVVDANPNARRMALVGSPLGPQLTTTVAWVDARDLVSEKLPWPDELLGPLSTHPYSASLARLYVNFAKRPAAADPRAEVFLVAAGGDVVAPPECVRLPSLEWSNRLFFRADAFSHHPLKHGDLLRNEAVIRRVRRYFQQ